MIFQKDLYYVKKTLSNSSNSKLKSQTKRLFTLIRVKSTNLSFKAKIKPIFIEAFSFIYLLILSILIPLRVDSNNNFKISLSKMKNNKQNQKVYPGMTDKPKIAQRQCQLGWECQKVLRNMCKFKHDPNDKHDIEAINRIKKNKIIIISDTYYKQIRPVCLFEIYLPIKVINHEQIKIEVGKYYVGIFVKVENRYAIIQIERCLGNFGHWRIERQIYMDHLPQLFEKCKPKQNYRQRRGKIKINGALKKVLQGEEGLRQVLQKVNEKCRYPLLEGCQVSYFEKNRVIQISRIKYPEYKKFSGILEIDGLTSQFYFISRSANCDKMNPYRIPDELNDKLKQLTHTIPYTVFKKEQLKRSVQQKVNDLLKTFLVKGEFEEWPLQSKYPIITLENQIQQRNFQSQKEGIIYETGITIRSFTKNEKKECEKLVNKYKPENYDHRKHYKGKIFTVDNKNTKCHDDALYIEEIQNGNFKVQIHIADLVQILKFSKSLESSIKSRDSTLYIKDYFQPMIHDSLRNKVSLSSDNEKLALTLQFEVTKQGSIDFASVRFINSVIEVERNLAHQKLQKGTETYPQLFKLGDCLDKGELLKESSLIQYGSKSEFSMSKVIELSGLIPTIMLELNIQRSKEFKKKFEDYLKKVMQQKQKDMQLWQNEVDKINKVLKELNLTQKKQKKIKDIITKEINRQRNLLVKKIKDQMKAISVETKKEKKQKIKANQLNDGQAQSQSQTEQESDQQNQEPVMDALETTSISPVQQTQLQQMLELNELLLKQKRAKALKQMKNEQNFISSSSSEQQLSEDQSDQEIQLNEGYRMTKAMGGKNFMTKIFDHFGIRLQWQKESQINDAFKKILSLDKGKLYQEYFKKIQITNRQHFSLILKATKRLKKAQKQSERNLGNQRAEQKSSKKEDRQKRKNQKKDYPEKVQPKINEQIRSQNSLPLQTSSQQPKSGGNNNQNAKKKRNYQMKNEADNLQQRPKLNQKQEKLPQKQIGAQKIGKTFMKKSSIMRLQDKKQQQITNSPMILPDVKENPISQQDQLQGFQMKNSPTKDPMPLKLPMPSSNKQFKEPLKKIQQQKRIKKQKPIFSEIEKQKFDKMINQTEKNIKQIQEKYYDLIRNGKDFEVSYTEQQNLLFKQNSEQFKIRYSFFKRKTIIKVYQKIKKQKIANQRKLLESQNLQQKQNQDLMQQQETQQKLLVEKKDQNNLGNKKPQRTRQRQNKNDKVKNQIKQQKKTKSQAKALVISEIKVLQNVKNDVEASQKKEICQGKVQTINQISVQKNIQSKVQQTKKIISSEIGQSKNQDSSKKVKNEKQSVEPEQSVDGPKQQPKQEKNKNTLTKPVKKKSKKEINKMVQQLIKPISEQIKAKYKEQLQKIAEQKKKLKNQEEDAAKLLKLELQKSNIHYNLIRLMTFQEGKKQQEQSQNQSQAEQSEDEDRKGRKRNKNKKKNKKNKKSQKKKQSNIFQQILENFESYGSKSKYNFKIMKHEQLDQFLQKELQYKLIFDEEDYSVTKLNQEAIKMIADKLILKWNNPIRSYESLMAMRLIKEHDWLFQGNVFPTEIIQYGDQLKKVEKKLKKLGQYHDDKIANGQNDKKVKQANRQIDYLQFYYKLKKNPDQVYTFLNISSPTPKIKRVFHEVLGDVDLENTRFVQELYKQVKGKVKIVRDFPIKLKIEIIQ